MIFPSTQAFADVEPDHPAEVADVAPIPKKRFRTEDQKSLRNVEKYPLLPPCADSCRKKCADKLTELHRQLINATHWGKAFVARRGFLDTHIAIAPKGRSKSDVQGQSDRSGWLEEQSNYSITPLLRPPSKSDWSGRKRGVVVHEGLDYFITCGLWYTRI